MTSGNIIILDTLTQEENVPKCFKGYWPFGFLLLFPLLFSLQSCPAVILCIFFPFFFDFGGIPTGFVSLVPFSQTTTTKKRKRNIWYRICFSFRSSKQFLFWEKIYSWMMTWAFGQKINLFSIPMYRPTLAYILFCFNIGVFAN